MTRGLPADWPPSRAFRARLFEAHAFSLLDLDHVPVMDDDLHDTIAKGLDVPANQVKPAGIGGCFLGSFDLGWPVHGQGGNVGWLLRYGRG